MTWRTLCAAVLASAIVSSPAVARTLGDNADVSAARRASKTANCLPPALRAALARIRASCGNVRVISGHRPGARIAGTSGRSYHASCRAVDFHAPRGCALRVLSGWSGGLGTYAGSMNHIHLDTGPQVRFAHGGRTTRVAGRRSARQRVARAAHAVSSQRKYRRSAKVTRHMKRGRYVQHRRSAKRGRYANARRDAHARRYTKAHRYVKRGRYVRHRGRVARVR